MLRAADLDGAASELKGGRVGVEEMHDYVIGSAAFKSDYQLPDSFRFHVYLREMLAQAVCDVIDVSWITWLALLLPGAIGWAVTYARWLEGRSNADDDFSYAAGLSIGLACLVAALAVATSAVCHYNLLVLRRSLGLSRRAGRHLGPLGRLLRVCRRTTQAAGRDWVNKLTDHVKRHDAKKSGQGGATALHLHPATAHLRSHDKRDTHGALQRMLVLRRGPAAFWAFRLWVQTIVLLASMLLALYILHFRVNVSSAAERAGFLLSTCLTLLLAPDMVFVQGMIEAYTLPRVEVIDAVMHDEQLFEQDLAYLHEHVNLMLGKAQHARAPAPLSSMKSASCSGAAHAPASERGSALALGAVAVRLDAAFHLAPHGTTFWKVDGAQRDEHRVLREFLRDIDAPISLERLRRLERFLDSSVDGENDVQEQMMRRLHLTEQQVEQLRARRKQRLDAATGIGVPAIVPPKRCRSWARASLSAAIGTRTNDSAPQQQGADAATTGEAEAPEPADSRA